MQVEQPFTLSTDDQDIATAPGDLPLREVRARFTSLRTQFRHDNTIAPLAPRPGQPVEIVATAGTEVPVGRAAIFFTTDGSQPDEKSTYMPMELSSVEWSPETGYVRHFGGFVPGQEPGTIVRYRVGGWQSESAESGVAPDLWAHDGQGFWFKYPGTAGITTFAYPVHMPGPVMPDWMHDAVIYHIFVDRFHPGNTDGRFTPVATPRTRHGGTLNGIRQSLPYLQELGVTCVWLSPIHPSRTYHRYDGEDYFGIDPALGTDQDFRDLVEELHARGMRIWMDYVPSHCSWKHPAFLAAQRDRQSKTYRWFTFTEWPNAYRNFLGASKYLPSFNLDDPGARAYVIDSAVHWLRNFGVDGFRLDHAIAPSMDFWTAFMAATEKARPDGVNVGEATDTPDSLRRYRGRLHGILDFEFARVIRLAFGRGEWNISTLDTWLHSYQQYMAEGPGRVSFLDNHDMDRFLWIAGNRIERLKLAALFQFTLPPTPVIYYGTEIGLTQRMGSADGGFGGDENARGDMNWNEEEWNKELLNFYSTLNRLRREHPILATAGLRTVHIGDKDGAYAYVRGAADCPNGDTVVVILNLGDEEAVVALPADIAGRLGEPVASTGKLETVSDGITIDAWSGAAFVLAESF